VNPIFRDIIFSQADRIIRRPLNGSNVMRTLQRVPRPKKQKARAPIILASGPSKPYEVWRLQLSAHAHVPHSRQIAGQQRNVIEATLIENNLYEAT
jgi:hypothetical protein